MQPPKLNNPDQSQPAPRSRRTFLKTIRNGCIVGAGLLGWTGLVEPFWLDVNEQVLAVNKLPPTWANKRVVQISDLHVGRTNQAFLYRAMEVVNSLEPDVLLVTGDLIDLRDRDADLDSVLDRLQPARLATFCSLGNHDYGLDYKDTEVADEVTKTVHRHSMRMLRNERLTIDGLDIIGLEDFWSPLYRNNLAFLQNDVDLDRPGLCLCHNPDVCDVPIWGEFHGVIISGHTHGGQCKPPFLPPPLLPVVNRNYTQGHFQLDSRRQLYITRGLGYTYQVRFNCRPEITVFRLEAAESPKVVAHA